MFAECIRFWVCYIKSRNRRVAVKRCVRVVATEGNTNAL